ncbi:hypothetical protein SSPIM334S_04378 [Streptomyces spiroverticillatus]
MPTSWPWALRKVYAMPPPTRMRSAFSSRSVDRAELVGDLGAADDDVRALDVLGELLQDADLGGDEVAGGVRQAGREVEDRGVLAVHRAEAVADVQVGEGGELVGEGAALGVVLGRLHRR